jgi:hypothetical protein
MAKKKRLRQFSQIGHAPATWDEFRYGRRVIMDASRIVAQPGHCLPLAGARNPFDETQARVLDSLEQVSRSP